MSEGFKGKIVADLGCGTGLLGIGALLLGAEKTVFVDVDENAIYLAKKNLKKIETDFNTSFNAEFLNISVKDFHEAADIVIQNPPFGVQTGHADRAFLIKAMQISNSIYSFHKIESDSFVQKLAMDHGFTARLYLRYKFPLKHSMRFHTKQVHYVDVGCFKIEKK